MMRVFSFGGGVQGNAALVLAADGKIEFQSFLFCNVGDDSENPDTIKYVREVSMPFAKSKGIKLLEIARLGETIYQRLLRDDKSIGIPVRMEMGAPGKRDCTHNYKREVIRKWLGEGEHVVGLGISVDEFHRARSDSGYGNIVNEYPLIERRLTRMDCHKIIGNAGLPTPPKSACWFCPYHRMSMWKDMRANRPDLFQKSVELEKMLADRAERLGRGRVFLTYKGKPLDEVVGDQLPLFNEESCESGYCMV